MTARRILGGDIPQPVRAPQLVAAEIPPERLFTFSLRYWQQREYFGLGEVSAGWLRSLLERIAELCRERVARFFDDLSFQDRLRFHSINWDARNIPLSRADFDWLPPAIRDNDEEFPLFQFQLSKSLGRIHGFWDGDLCFNIVLVDPVHNLQPSKDVGYRIANTTIARCEYSALKAALDQVLDCPCNSPECRLRVAVQSLSRQPAYDQLIVVAGLSEDVVTELRKVREGGAFSISEAVSHGIVFLNG